MSQLKAHFHITLGDVDSEQLMFAAKLIGAKCTTIDLHRDTRSQRDRMLTKYQKGIELDTMQTSVSKLEQAGFKVLRYKLELMFDTVEDWLEQSFTQDMYGEVHIKTQSSHPTVETGFFQLSSNAEEVDYRFYNGRVYSAEDKLLFLKAYQTLVDQKVPIKGSHLEKTIFDSKYQFDSWWA